MKSYKEAEKIFIGESDIAALVLVGCKGDKGVVPEMLHFVEDGEYSAYLVKGNDVEIGKHYEKVATFNYWLNIYDDTKRTFSKHAKEFNIYRAGDYGCIIQMIAN